MILSSDKSSERNLSCFFDIKKPRRIEHLQSEEPFSSDPYFRSRILLYNNMMCIKIQEVMKITVCMLSLGFFCANFYCQNKFQIKHQKNAQSGENYLIFENSHK